MRRVATVHRPVSRWDSPWNTPETAMVHTVERATLSRRLRDGVSHQSRGRTAVREPLEEVGFSSATTATNSKGDRKAPLPGSS